MNRSEINEIIRASDAFIRSFGFVLPPFAYWSPAEMKARTSTDSALIRQNFLGWDITDYGQGRFADLGLFLFTVRNGSAANVKSGMGVLYAEKIMISKENQISPMHRHNLKTEDIINRGGGRLIVQLYNSTEDEGLADTPVTVKTDGVERTVPAGGTVELSPGESITLEPYCYHAFWATGSTVLVGEVSTVNDDSTDNRFFEPVGRFPTIEEDEAPLYLLVGDYDRYYRAGSAG